MAYKLSDGAIFEAVIGLDFSKWLLLGPEIYIFAYFKTSEARRMILVSRNKFWHMSFPMELFLKLSEVWIFLNGRFKVLRYIFLLITSKLSKRGG